MVLGLVSKPLACSKNTTQDECLKKHTHRDILFKLQKTQNPREKSLKETRGIKYHTYIRSKIRMTSNFTEINELNKKEISKEL